MSQHLWNIHNYSKSPQAQSPICQQPNSISGNQLSNEDPTKQNDHDISTTEQNGDQQSATRRYSQTQVPNNHTIELTSWREKASVEEWKAFLLSASSTAANGQTQQMQRQQTRYSIGTNPDSDRIPQQHPTAYISYSYAVNGGYRPVVGHETKRNSGAIDNRRAFMEKLRLNNTAVRDWFAARLQENRMKAQYNYYPPGLIERIKLEKERLRAGIAHVETLMRNPNEHGYVMLDDRAISVLVTIIDRILPNDISLEMFSPQSYEY